jgi:hypothetical protein
MKKLPFILTGLLLVVSTACSKRHPYTCYCKTSESTGVGEKIGESFPKSKKEKAEETCEIFSNTERTCSPVFAK